MRELKFRAWDSERGEWVRLTTAEQEEVVPRRAYIDVDELYLPTELYPWCYADEVKGLERL